MRSRPVTVFFMLVFTVSALLLGRLLWEFLTPIMLAGALASLSVPILARLTRWLDGRKRLAAGLTTALIVVCVIAPIAVLVVSLSQQAYGIYLDTRVVSMTERLRQLLESDSQIAEKARRAAELMGVDASPQGLVEASAAGLKAVGLWVYDQLRGVAANTVSLLLDFVVMVLLVFTFLSEGSRLKRWLMELSPLPTSEEEELLTRFALIGRAVFLGNGVSGLLQGVLGGVGFAMVGLGHALLWGTVMGFLALLPIAGASMVFVPAAAWLALQGHTPTAIGFLAYNLIYVGLVEYVLKPRLIGSSSRMNSVFVFVSILAGLKLFGLIGIFYGPLFVAMFLTLSEMYLTRYQHAIHGDNLPETPPDIGASAAESTVP